MGDPRSVPNNEAWPVATQVALDEAFKAMNRTAARIQEFRRERDLLGAEWFKCNTMQARLLKAEQRIRVQRYQAAHEAHLKALRSSPEATTIHT